MVKIKFSEEQNRLNLYYQGFEVNIDLDSSIFSNCDKYIDRIKEFNLEALSFDDLVEFNKLIYDLRRSLKENVAKKNIESLKKALSEIHAAIIMLRTAISYISGEASGVAIEEAANC